MALRRLIAARSGRNLKTQESDDGYSDIDSYSGTDDSGPEVKNTKIYMQKALARCKRNLDSNIAKFNPRERYKTEQRKRYPREPPVQYEEVSEIKTMSVFPSESDLFGGKPELKKNIVTGAYESVDHYLTVQFKLLHEDFIAPLREGIAEYLSRPKNSYSKKTSDVIVFQNVKILRGSVDSGELGHIIQLNKKVNWAPLLQFFIYGSLLLFTTNDFKSFFLATVIRAENRSHTIMVKLHGSHITVCENIYNEEFVVAVSKVFFEPYFHVLTALQNMTRVDFPMAKYIVDVDPKTNLPGYTRRLRHTKYTIYEKEVDILDQVWPQFTSVKFNPSQHRAFKAALTNEFVVIQGPPGTGKTFLGHQIVTALLENASDCTPILVVCFKNHALDQFLEGLIKKTKRIIRIGGRSKNKNLEEFNLKNHRKRYGYSMFEATLRNLARKYLIREKELDELKTRGIVGVANILPYISCPRFKAEMMHTDYEEWLMEGVYVDQEMDILSDLDFENFHIGFENESEAVGTETIGGVRQSEPSANIGKRDQDTASANQDVTFSTQLDESRKRLEELFIDDYSSVYKDIHIESKIGEGKNRPWRSKSLVEKLNTYSDAPIPQYTVTILELKNSCSAYEYMIQELFESEQDYDPYQQYRILAFQNNITDVKARINFLKRMLPRKSKLDAEHAEKLYKIGQFTIWSLTIRQRWELYHFWLTCLAKDIKKNMIQLEKSIRNVEEQLKQARNGADLSVLKKADVVGMTTTGAARLRPMLNRLGAKIVVIEEAAEVLESHIVTALSKECQHVVLIGDHKQLRPNPAVYQLCTKYNFDISLFERMVKNGMSCYTLDVQHRMRPEFASLIVPAVYPTLTDHQTTKGRPNILGIHHNLYFIHHNRREEQLKNSVSHANQYEAEYVVELSRYLVLQGYSTEEITILSTYAGQVKSIIKLINEKYSKKLQNLRVTTVDDFQGEENKIIILSLVRSNEEKSIGFLKTENRVCVALSRARNGLYIIGNMDLLAENSEIWPKVKERLLQHSALGTSLSVYCQNHPETVMRAKEWAMFGKLPEGGCLRMCEAKLCCGHVCKYHCHPCDQRHEEQYVCSRKCDRKICIRNHNCPRPCGKPCLPCQQLTDHELSCGHIVRDICSSDPAKLKCTTELPCVWPLCGHKGTRYCGETVRHAWKRQQCQELCGRELDCGHSCVEGCHEEKKKLSSLQIKSECTKVCRAPVDVELGCGHPVVVECCAVRPYPQPSLLVKTQCHKMMEKTYPCGHSTSIPCHIFKFAKTCGVTVEKVLQCGHKQKMRCGTTVDTIVCTEMITRVLFCGHKQEALCSTHLASLVCKDRCAKVLPCGHPCTNTCSETCNCTVLVKKELSCGHRVRSRCGQERVLCDQQCKQVLPCGHACQALCSLPCDPGKCMVMVEVNKRPACGHGLVIGPCFFNLEDSKDCAVALVKYCKAVCSTRLACGHPCPGLCCSSKQQHATCNSPCSKIFPCSHMCSQMCKDKCTPCYNKCLNRCSHKKCDGICGEACSPCKEPCAWKCAHSRCTRTCSTFCNRKHCDFPCPLKLACGHSCSGFCGEVCPQICLQCDLQAAQVPEDRKALRLVVLEDCGHTVSAASMDSVFFNNHPNIVKCPVTSCQQPIVSTKRYRNQVRTVLNKIRYNKREQLEFKEHALYSTSYRPERNIPFHQTNSGASSASTRNKSIFRH